MPGDYVARLEAVAPGWLNVQLDGASRWVDSLLVKRCETPFLYPYPLVVKMWVSRLVTASAYQRLGVDPMDRSFEIAATDAALARAEIEAAAKGSTGLIELPLREGEAPAFARPRTRVSSAASPFAHRDSQQRIGRQEDKDRNGGTVR